MDPTALGRYLRESREAKELTLEDAVRSLRIRREILESFEQGNFDVADSPVRIRGLLRNYARFIGLEEERVLQYYEAAQNQQRRIRRRFGRREPRTEPIAARSVTDTQPTLPAVSIGTRRRFDFGGFIRNIAFILLSVAAIIVIVFVISSMLDLPALLKAPTEIPATVDNSGTITPTNTPSITPMTLEATFTPDNIARGIVSVQIHLEMTQRSYVRILVDDAEVYAGVLEPGESMQLEGSETVQIVAGNAAALNIVYNDVEQGLFGGRGQQVDLRFTVNGVEAKFGEGELLATGSPSQLIELVTPTSLFSATEEQTPVVENVITELPTPTTFQPDAVTATTFLSAVDTPTPFLASAVEPSATTLVQASASTDISEATATTVNLSPTPTLTLSPTATATSQILLPLRETPSNPTATKSK